MAIAHDGVAIILAAGQGSRMGSAAHAKKQFRSVGGKTLLQWSVERFDKTEGIDAIVVVTPEDDRTWVELAMSRFSKVRAVVSGGDSRQQSVSNGLKALSPQARWVVVHDAARPLVEPDLVRRVLDEAKKSGAAIAALPVRDTIKRVGAGGNVVETLNRSELWAVQTPQAFARDLLERAHREATVEATDDAALVESLGVEVRVVEGSSYNLKVTTESDLQVLEAWLGGPETAGNTSSWEVVTGFGFDVHRLEAGRPLIIGGVHIEHPVGLAGHSDADVLAHAITDALLGGAGLGDIGTHFPDTDPRYKGADSMKLLQSAGSLVENQGCVIVHIDAFVSAEAPRLKSHIPQMRQRIAGVLGLDVERVSVKAGTGEGAGPVGRAEVMEARAVATLRRRFR